MQTTTTYQVVENQASITVIAGSDEDAGAVLSITGGVDMALQIDATTGALTFKLLQIMKVPVVSGTNDYLVEITLTDDNAPTPATSLSALALTVQVTDVNDDPTITTAAAIAVNEEKTEIATFAASDEDSGDTLAFSITDGADKDQFAIDSSRCSNLRQCT